MPTLALPRPPRSLRTLLFGSAMHVWSDLFFALLAPLLPLMKDDLDLTFTEVGMLRSVFTGASAVLQIPAGLLAESAGEFWLLVIGNFWVSAGLLAMALSGSFVFLLAFSAVGGLGGGAQHPLASSMVSRAYDDRGRAGAVGTVNFAGDLGKMTAPLVAGFLAGANPAGWRTAFWWVGWGGIAFMLASVLARRFVDIGRPARQRKSARQDGGEDGDVVEERAKLGGFAALSVVGALDGAVRTSALVFLPFVMASKGMGPVEISAALALLFAGGAAGKFVCGWLGDRMGALSLIWATKGLTAALLIASIYAPAALILPLAVLIGIGLNGTSSVLYATVATFVPSGRRGRFYGFFYTTNEIGSVAAPLAYGAAADAMGVSAAMILMGAATAAILPVSLTLRNSLREAGF